MNAVKTFDQWAEGTTIEKTYVARISFKAGQRNAPEKMCEWTPNGDDSFKLACSGLYVLTYAPPRHCPSCGGKITVKQTTKQKLAAANKHLSELASFIGRMGIDYDRLSIDDAMKYIKENGLEK